MLWDVVRSFQCFGADNAGIRAGGWLMMQTAVRGLQNRV